MSEVIAALGEGLEIWKVSVDDLREQDVNARVMSKRMFEHLAQTIGKDKRLESLPLVAKTARGVEIVSGHHRVRAARQAGVTDIHAIVDVTGLTDDEIKAKQLAHNAIAGVDDEQVLAKLYESIKDVNARIESFIDPEQIESISRMTVPPPKMDVGVDYRHALITFLPYEKARFEKNVEALIEALPGKDATIYLNELKMLDRWREVTKLTGREYDIRATGTVLAQMARIVEEHLGVPSDIPDEPVPIRAALGTALLDPETAKLLKQAIRKAGGIREMAEQIING
jgi:hypothetical protein